MDQTQAQETPDPSVLEPKLASVTDETEAHEGPEPPALEPKLASATEETEAQESPEPPLLEAKPSPAMDRMQVQENRDPVPAEAKPAIAIDQVIYKGVVGNLLEGMPIDPDKRVQLQRTNAVVSNVVSARSLAILLGVANPVLMIGGLVWGVWSASQIKPAEVAAGGLCVDKDEAQNLSAVLVDAPAQ